MAEKSIENVASQIQAIKDKYGKDIIKEYEVPSLCDTKTAETIGYAVVVRLNVKYSYTLDVLEDMKKMLDASLVTIKVNKYILWVTFKVYCV